MVKHQVRPGITGWAQVNGFRGDTSIQGRIEHDIYYIENWTLLFDIKILFMTVFKFSNNETPRQVSRGFCFRVGRGIRKPPGFPSGVLRYAVKSNQVD